MIYLYFTILVVISAFMDFCNFYRRRDVGFFCIHTRDQNDTWHWARKIFWFVLALGLMFIDFKAHGWQPYLIILVRLGTLNYFVHQITLHHIFKRFSNL